MKVSLVVLALMVGANASVNHQTQPQGGNDQISNILVRFDGFSGFSQDDTPLYPPLTQPEPSAAQTFRLVPAPGSQSGNFRSQTSGFGAPPAPATQTRVLKLNRVSGGSSAGYTGGASSGYSYSTPQVQQSQTFSLRQVQPESAGFAAQSGGFNAPIPASFTLRRVEGGASSGGSFQGHSSYGGQRSGYGSSSSYSGQSSSKPFGSEYIDQVLRLI